MKRTVTCLATLAVVPFALSQGSGAKVFQTSLKALNDAKSLKATFTSQVLGGAPATFSIEFSKPNKARIETPTGIIIADGSTVVTYDKQKKTYFKDPQTGSTLGKLLGKGSLKLWAPFFDLSLADKPTSVKPLGTVSRRGMSLTAIEVAYPAKDPTVANYYINPSDNLIRQVSIAVKTSKGTETTLIDAKKVEVNGTIDEGRFAFKAPEGSRELTEAERNSAKWYTNFEEACAAAKATNRLVLVDFYTDWCSWCKVLREEVFPKEEFKAMSKYFVFCEIDAEAERTLAAKYFVSAYPTSAIVMPDGTLVDQVVGYKPTAEYVADLEAARRKAGLSDR